MIRSCAQCNQSFEIDSKDLAFLEKVAPRFAAEVFPLPLPTLCPQHRKQRRLAFRNERHLYQRTCDLTGARIVSIFSADKPYRVYHSPDWWSDKWEALAFGLNYKPAQSFFSQFAELLKQVPLESLFIQPSENCEYINYSGRCKSCYLLFNCTSCEECLYSRGLIDCRTCLDCSFCTNDELCYECINCHNSYGLTFCTDCAQCSENAYLSSCIGCNNCLGCVNLAHKDYFVLNERSDAVTVANLREQLKSSRQARTDFEARWLALVKNTAKRASVNVNVEDCCGEYLTRCARCAHCYETTNSEDCRYCDSIKNARDVCDAFGFCVDSELLYEVVATGRSQRTLFCASCSSLDSSLYCAFCHSSHDLLGCVGLRHKEYCILNTQYSRAEYERLAQVILNDMRTRGEWGEFFPATISPFGYNETVAQDLFPLDPATAARAGFNWSSYQAPSPHIASFISAELLPACMPQDYSKLLSSPISSLASGRFFRLTALECSLYERLALPPPQYHPEERHLARLARMRSRELQEVSCSRCSSIIMSSLRTDGNSAIYCEKCFQSEALH